MLVAAAKALGAAAAAEGASGTLLPPIGTMREVAYEVALAAVRDGVARRATEAELRAALRRNQWVPDCPA